MSVSFFRVIISFFKNIFLTCVELYILYTADSTPIWLLVLVVPSLMASLFSSLWVVWRTNTPTEWRYLLDGGILQGRGGGGVLLGWTYSSSGQTEVYGILDVRLCGWKACLSRVYGPGIHVMCFFLTQYRYKNRWRRRSISREGGACESLWRERCSWSPPCSASTSRRTISTWMPSSGWTTTSRSGRRRFLLWVFFALVESSGVEMRNLRYRNNQNWCGCDWTYLMRGLALIPPQAGKLYY